ncbi:phosphotransferase [Paenibacillus turpanensis]|uniref:phosphotransferase n=1 Tax=Paenibacillus turpanensis TaxID=2689078 RepID=UPI00140A3219
MLKFKYLFHNVDLAEMLLKHWEFDESSLDMFKHYRISSNAIYPFKREGKIQLLRFAPQEEKLETNLRAELDFIAYLHENGCGVLKAVESKGGVKLVEAKTPWGEYFATVFERVPGKQLNAAAVNDLVVYKYGQALGKLHSLSSQYHPDSTKRWSYEDVFDWIEAVLARAPALEISQAASAELTLLRHYFAAQPKSNSNFGLIHYDFEYDNVFYDENTQSCYIIDFDDAMYHWYAMDMERTLASMQSLVSSGTETCSAMKRIFLEGYESVHPIPADLDQILPACSRFADLYGVTRILHASLEKWEHEPNWLVTLRRRLGESMVEAASNFGKML